MNGRCNKCKEWFPSEDILVIENGKYEDVLFLCRDCSQKTSIQNNQETKTSHAVQDRNLSDEAIRLGKDKNLDTDALRNPVLDTVTPLEGCRLNPQDESGVLTSDAKDDTGVVPSLRISKSKLGRRG